MKKYNKGDVLICKVALLDCGFHIGKTYKIKNYKYEDKDAYLINDWWFNEDGIDFYFNISNHEENFDYAMRIV